MSEPSIIDWNTGDKSAMVSIGTHKHFHKLYMSTSGPDRKPGEPIVVLMTGMGSTMDEWVLVKRLVTPFARWLEYDRSGLGRSEDPVEAPEETTAASVAADLDFLLKITEVPPPYVIIAHSWAGLTSREFIHLQEREGRNIAGIVFVDTITEFSDVRDTIISRPAYVKSVADGIDSMAISSLVRDKKLSREEWDVVEKQNNDPRARRTQAAELKGYSKDRPALASKKQVENQILGDRPVSVLATNTTMDVRAEYEAGVAAENGTEEERAQHRALIDKFAVQDPEDQKEQLKLSSVGRYTFTETNGHNVQMTEPQLVVDEIKWVLDHIAA